MRRYCPNCKLLIEGETAVCPHCPQPLPRVKAVNVKRSNTTVPQYSAWDKLRYRRRHRRKFRDLQALYIIGLLAMGWALISGKWQFVVVGFVLGLFAVILMALSVIVIKMRTKRSANLLYDHKDEQSNEWLETLAQKDRNV